MIPRPRVQVTGNASEKVAMTREPDTGHVNQQQAKERLEQLRPAIREQLIAQNLDAPRRLQRILEDF